VSAQPQVTIENLKNFKLLIPSREVLNAYEPNAYLVEDRIEGKNRQAQTLVTLRDTLLPRLISGQLRLPEAEVMREAVAG
jgi:type I restriction enzyme S subunit